MWPGGIVDWVILCSGYVLALGLFIWLGGFRSAGNAITSWARSSTHGSARRRAT